MIRGLYTGASGMVSQMHRMDALANNLANVDTTGYKRDTAIMKSFPELLLRRASDNGEYKLPVGSVDVAPVVGKVGLGAEMNELFTVFEQGSLKETENPFDLAIEGEGFFAIQTNDGVRYTRNGSFVLTQEGVLTTKDGFPVLGENGVIQLKKNNFIVDSQGQIWQNALYAEDPNRLVSMEENDWEQTELVDTLRVVDFTRERYLKKQGSSFWMETDESGPASQRALGAETKVRQGFIESANVNPVTEMVRMIEVNRTYEANSRMMQTQNELLGRLLTDVLKI